MDFVQNRIAELSNGPCECPCKGRALRHLVLAALGVLAFAGPAPAQDPSIRTRPAVRSSDLPVLRTPELEILSVRRTGGATRPVRRTDLVPVEVIVRNTGQAPAIVQAATTAANVREGRGILRLGGTATVEPGGSAILPLELDSRGMAIRGDDLETLVLLLDGRNPSIDPLRRKFRDRDEADNQMKFQVALIRTFDVEVALEELHVTDDCDNVSPGDWIVHFGAGEYKDASFVQSDSTFWPGTGPANVSSGSTVRPGKRILLPNVSADSEIHAWTSAHDCDSNSIIPVHISFSGLSYTLSISCGGEEVYEASGHGDRAGDVMIRIPPSAWRSGGVFRSTPEQFTAGDCGSNAYRTQVRIAARAR